MADEQNRPKWYHTAPGYLTATAALVGSISAAVAGLSQMGVFRSKSPEPAPAVAPASAPPSSVEPRRPSSGATHRSAPEPRAPSRNTASGGKAATSPAPSATPQPPAQAPAPAPAPAPPPAAPVAKTGTIGPGTSLELASGSRVCSTSSNSGDKFTATTVVPVSGSNGVTLPVGTQVILGVVLKTAPVFIGANGVSLDVGGKTVKVSGTASAQTEFAAGANQTGFGIGACIPEGGRISLRLTDGVTITTP